jgi:hypothetical protein
MLSLSNLTPFGIGGRRLCFSHPTDKGKCVKVLRIDEQRTVRIKKLRLLPAFMHRAYNNNAHEKKILSELQQRIGVGMNQHLPLCYGTIETDLGRGLVLDLVRDHDGKISRSVRELVSIGHDVEEFREAFDEFGEFLIEHRVLTRNLLDHNIVVRYLGCGKLKMYLIDGFGDPAWLPFARWFESIARAKIKKRLRTAWHRFETFADNGGVTQRMIDKSSWGQGILKHRD